MWVKLTKQQKDDIINTYKTQWKEVAINQVKNIANNPTTQNLTTSTNQNVNVPTNSYGDRWGAANSASYQWYGVSSAGNYTYNQNLTTKDLKNQNFAFWGNAVTAEKNTPWYLENRNNKIANALYNEWKYDEQAVRNYLGQFSDYNMYDKTGQDNTVTAIMNRMWNLLQTQWYNNRYNSTAGDINSQIMNNYNEAQKWYSELMWWGANYYDNFRDAVEWKLQKAYWISDLEEFKSRYPDQYQSMYDALASVEWVRDSTNPEERQMLDGYLQWIIWTWVGAWSDWSKLNVLNQALKDKFVNWEKVSQDMQNIVKLQTEWKTTKEIAKEMWISEDQVQQAILAYNWLDNKLWEYYQLKDNVANDITEPYDTKMQRLEEEKKIALDRANRNVDRLKEDFDTSIERQKQQNDINAHNADAIAWRTGLAFSKRGIEWINYVNTQAQQILDDITKNYDRNNQEMADGIADIIRNWQRNNEDLMKASQDALTAAKNNFTSNMLAVQQQYWTVGLQAQQYLAQNVQSFIEQAQNIYDNALVRQQQNLSNLITNVSNLNAIAAQNLTLRQAKIEQFQAESMNLNRNQLQNLADQLWMDTASYQDLVNYQAQAVANQLNWYIPWSWVQFQDQIQSLLNQWYTPQQAMQSIMKSADFQAAQVATNGGSDSRAMSNGIMYNKSTGEYYDLNWDEYWTIWDNLYNKRTGQIISAAWAGGMSTADGTNYISSETINGQTYGVSQETYQWLQSFIDLYIDDNWNVIRKWGQCGKFVNDYLQSMWLDRVFTDPIDKKKAAINTPDWYTGQIGDVIVMDSPSKPENWHVAIIVWVNEDWTYTTLESNKAWEWEIFSRTIDPSKTKIYWYYHPDGEVSQWISTYDLNTATMRIGRMAYWKNISEWEWKRVEETLKEWMKAGKSTNEILYDILWMTITKNQAQADPFIDIMIQNSDADGLSAYNVQWFADFINKWQFTQAMNLVEQAVAKERWGNFSKDLAWYENGAKYAYEKWNELIDLINKESSKLWIVAGNVSKWKSKFMKDSNYQKISSAIVNYVADWRHEMLWAATTETELKMIDDLLPSVTDNPFNAITKIQEFQDYWLRKYNNTRGNLYLPAVSEDSLLDKKKRLQLYLSWGMTKWRWMNPDIDLSQYGRTQ